jgi:hypothetical protein
LVVGLFCKGVPAEYTTARPSARDLNGATKSREGEYVVLQFRQAGMRTGCTPHTNDQSTQGFSIVRQRENGHAAGGYFSITSACAARCGEWLTMAGGLDLLGASTQLARSNGVGDVALDILGLRIIPHRPAPHRARWPG